MCLYGFRPIIHREALTGSASGRRKSSAPLRPVMDRSCGGRRESGAQTDISALPAQWRSESYLAHKVAHTFTTLPSKFALPAGMPGRLRLSDKTREARRVMLSDISFTSMVPELSRSADHLCHDPPHAQVPSSTLPLHTTQYTKTYLSSVKESIASSYGNRNWNSSLCQLKNMYSQQNQQNRLNKSIARSKMH